MILEKIDFSSCECSAEPFIHAYPGFVHWGNCLPIENPIRSNNLFKMKTLSLLFLVLSFTPVLAQNEDVKTTGDNSPAVIAKNFSATYGVRPDAIEAILWIYEAEGYDVQRRKNATEQILKMYAQSLEKQQKGTELSEASRQKMGLTDAPKIANALEWDLFARNHYLSTAGQNSPAVIAKGDVNIWYGIPPKALRALATQLEKNKNDLSDFEAKLADQVKKYEELKIELGTYGLEEAVYPQVEILLEEGKLEEAEKLIESDYQISKKRQAYKAFIFGKTKSLLLKYEEAASGYRDAVLLDNDNLDYHFIYACNENQLARVDEAIKHYQIALNLNHEEPIDTFKEVILLNNLGTAWSEKGEFKKALTYFEKVQEIARIAFGEQHFMLTTTYNNLGETWSSMEEYDKAIEYFEKALELDLLKFDENKANIAISYNNLGGALFAKGEYDKAIEYLEKSLEIDLQIYGEFHPDIAIRYNNLGTIWSSNNSADKAIGYHNKALEIVLTVFGEKHPNVASCYNNLGWAWSSKGEHDKAIECFNKGLKVDLSIFGELHPNIAKHFYSLGSAWSSKSFYDQAISYYSDYREVSEKIYGLYHPNQKIAARNLADLNHSRGMELLNQRSYKEALPYFKKALVNSEIISDSKLFLICLNNIYSTQISLKNYRQGLIHLDSVIQKVELFNQLFDQQVKKKFSAEELNDPVVNAEIMKTKNFDLIRRMKFHKALYLRELKRKKESKVLAKQLWGESIEANDTSLLEDLKKEDFDFRKN